MEHSIKKKVNRIGLIMQIVTIVVIVVLSIGCTALLAGVITVNTLPQDAAAVGIQTDMDVMLNEKLIGDLADEIPNEVPPAVADTIAGFLENNGEFGALTAEKTENGLMLRASTERMEFRMAQLESSLLRWLASCAIALTMFVFAKLLADALRRCDTPFSDVVIRRMTILSWALLFGGVAKLIALNGSVAFLLIAILMFFLTMIFRHGAALQRESDETL